MILSERVRDRITAAGLTQAELARRVNVTQGAIAKIAKNNPYRSSVLHLVARELGTTPAYLTGETDDPTSDAPQPPSMNSEERELFDHFGNLAPADRRAILQIARSLAGGAPPSETVHARGGGGNAAVQEKM
ncbi:MAG: hypothetical protein DI606_04290 [Sphingobium sp.]|uniref:helix-turn-helix domain-containing protein n=1 Tax=Sphingobium sp. TaxID=1912891 RepID=UPI000DB83793|nr:helix-turn-helix transcriptional regulator [Sphingobium sp.]PZU13793.1 MAG: hypothetical protein DI606_04290 [Sphingobium sp.]